MDIHEMQRLTIIS